MAARTPRPLWVGEIDIADAPSALVGGAIAPDGSPYEEARLLVRFGGEPLGLVTVPVTDGEIDLDTVRRDAFDRFRSAVDVLGGADRGPDDDGAPVLSAELAALVEGDLPAVSVVIGTRNRPDHVVACIERVLKQPYPSPVEVIVVDNGSVDGSTSAAIERDFGNDDRVRYMTEVRPGLSRARNIGLSAARYGITAFLSDDIRVDSLWLLAIARGFARNPAVDCVTGICPPAYLDTPEQLMFEGAMSWGSRQGFRPELLEFDSAEDPLHPYRIGGFANGSNMAYRTEAFRRLGGFDEALGPGTRARGGEDLDAPIRVLASGGRVAFEPAAIGWHADRYDDRPFHQHLYTYGLGLTAFLTKHLLDRRLRPAVLRRIPRGLPLLIRGFAEQDEVLHRAQPLPARLRLWHLAGRLAGPVAYLRSRSARRS